MQNISDLPKLPEPTEPEIVPESAENEASSDADGNAVEVLAARPGQVLVSTQTITHEYLTLNGKVARETVKNNGSVTDVMDFIYDESGRPFALNYSADGGSSFTTYYYILNLQGDVVKLIRYIPGFEYEEVASYEYDAWGNILSQSGSMAEKNPLRYRGYYYDNETGFYYLQSRYYDPTLRRFLNADSYTSTGQGFVGTNMFAYCNNSPVVFDDPTGHSLRPTTTVINDGGGPGYIDDQNAAAVADIPVGWGSVGWSGCGAVATYNALLTLNDKVSLEEVIDYYENHDYLLFNGLMGMPPIAIKNYFEDRGYKVITVEFSAENAELVRCLSKSADASIMWYAYRTSSIPYVGAHFIEYHKSGEAFVGHNTSAGVSTFNDPYSYGLKGRRFIAVGCYIFRED